MGHAFFFDFLTYSHALFLPQFNSIILNAWFRSLYMLNCYPIPNSNTEGTILYFLLGRESLQLWSLQPFWVFTCFHELLSITGPLVLSEYNDIHVVYLF